MGSRPHNPGRTKCGAVYDEIGQPSLERLFLGLTEDSMTQATFSAGKSGIGFNRARDIAAPAHLDALIAAKPHMQGMIGDAVLAGRPPSPPISAHSTTTSRQRRSCMYVQKAAQAADEAWPQTAGGLQGPVVTNPTIASLEHPSSASHSDDRDSAPRKGRLSAPQLQAQLSRLTDRSRLRCLKDTLFSKGAWQQVTRIEDL